MTGNFAIVNKDGLCIPKGTIVRVLAVDAADKLPEKGLVGAARCVAINDRSVSGGIWCAYLSPIPLSGEILKKNGWRYNDLPFICGWEQFGLTIYHNKIVCGHNVTADVSSVHRLQQFLTICGIEKEITLDGVYVDIPLEPLP